MFRQPLTVRQLRVLRFIVAHRTARGVAPTSREIAREIGISHQAADVHVRKIIGKGQLSPRCGRHRSIVLTTAGQDTLRCSSVGMVCGGGSGRTSGGVS